MKIAMIGHKVVPSRRGGIERVLTMLCPHLVELGAKVTCYNRSCDKIENEYIDTVKDNTYKGVKLKKSPTLNLKGASAMVASFSAAISASFSRADILHFHAEGPCASMWIPKLFGKKCIATVHGLDWQREKWGKGFASKYIHLGEKTLAKYADDIIVLSESAYDYFKQTYNREAVIIPNGIDAPRYLEPKLIKEKFSLEKDGYICIVSRLTAEKGIHYLIDAYMQINTDKRLVIAGDTSDTDEYAEKIKHMAKDNPNIIFTGFISGDTLCELYSNAYAAVLPSSLEGMSLSLLESMAYKNAVLCSDIPENIAVGEDRVMYFEKGNTDDLAKKLQLLCDDISVVQKLREGVDFVLDKYRWSEIAQSTYELYKKHLKG